MDSRRYGSCFNNSTNGHGMNLTRNFTLSELTKSDTAIRKGINNNPSPEQIEKLKLLCENILQPVRDHFGRVKITSGFRSQSYVLQSVAL